MKLNFDKNKAKTSKTGNVISIMSKYAKRMVVFFLKRLIP